MTTGRKMRHRWTLTLIAALVVLFAWMFVDEPLSPETEHLLATPVLDDRSVGVAELTLLESLAARRPIRVHEVWEICQAFDAACVSYLRANDLSELASASDQAFRDAARATAEVTLGLADLLETTPATAELFLAHRDLYLMDFITHGEIGADLLLEGLQQHRYRLAKAPSLLEKLFFLAAVSVDVSAANVAMLDEPGRSTIMPRLIPLDDDELGFVRAFAGEVRFSDGLLDAHPPSYPVKRNHLLNVTQAFYASLAKVSVGSWESFWGHEHRATIPSAWDYVFNPLGLTWAGVGQDEAYALTYLSNARLLDGQLATVRAIHSVDRACDDPERPASTFWVWEWVDGPSLCLVPKDVHASMAEYAERICVDWVGVTEGRACP